MAGPQISDFPRFRETVDAHLPGTLPMAEYFLVTGRRLRRYGFEDENTLGLVAACRDEIASPLVDAVVQCWGKTFSCRSLGGFLSVGRSGIATAVNHAPWVDGRHRFVCFAMPHVAISEEGQIGTVYREGMREASHACGSLAAVVAELESGRIDVRMDFDDLEQCCVRQKLLSALRYGDLPDLMGMTKLACRVIREDLERLLDGIVDPARFDYACLTGILIHGPQDTHWVWPQEGQVVSADLPGGRDIL